MAKAKRKSDEFDDGGMAAAAGFVPGRWYLWTTSNGFTWFGRYNGPLPMGYHQFDLAAHLRNAGGLELGEIAEHGPGPQTRITRAFPGPVRSYPVWWTDYLAEDKPWIR